MNEKANWSFRGYRTDAGNKVVQEWYREDITEDDRDLIRDRINYLEKVGRHLWKESYFESFGDIGEIKKRKTPRGALRLYGVFLSTGFTFLFLHGVMKKAQKDNKGIATARLRLKSLSQGVGNSHEFEF